MKKRLFALTLVLALSIAVLAGCGSKKEEEEEAPMTGMPNPVTEVTRAELIEKTGIELDGPVGSVDHTFTIIDMADGSKIAQVDFTLNGVSYTQRGWLKDQANLEEIAGIYFTEPRPAGIIIDHRNGTLYTGDGMCAVVWWDRVPGITYSLSCTENEDGARLMEVAEATFIPMQGEN